MTRSIGLRAALIMLVLISIAPVFVVVVQASLEEQQARLRRAEGSLEGMVDLGAAHQQRLVDGARQMLIAMASAPPLYQDDGPACVRYMQRLQSQYPVAYGSFGLLDAQGHLTCRATPPPQAVNSSDRLFFRAAIETGRFSVGDYTVSRASGRAVLTFGMPVYREGGRELRGVAYVALDVAQADQELRRLTLAPEMTLLVADANGLVLASAGVRPLSVGASLPHDFLRRAMSAGSAQSGRSRGAEGREWLFAAEPVGRPGERPLFVAGIASLEDVLAPSAQRLRAQLGALALITVLAAGVAWLFAERVLQQPMRRLLARVELLAREDERLDTEPAAGPVRELGELNLRFHAMARRLAERSVQRDGALAEMAHQKTLLESVLAGMAEGVLVVDPQGHFLHVNEAAHRILGGLHGLNRGAMVRDLEPGAWGVFLLDGCTPCEAGDWPVALALRGQTVQGFRYRVRGRLSAGEEKVIQGSARPMHTPGGGAAGAVVVFSDATAAWQAEQALLQVNESLERRVAERTGELFVANRELESFSYSVSHDLRAPLQVIDGFGKALLTRHAAQLDEKGRHYLDRIRENTQQMGQLIDDLLSLARVTRAEIKTERLDLGSKAAQAVERLRQRDPQRDVEVHIEEGLTCEGDPRLLAVVLQNLLENAWKFTGRVPRAEIRVGQHRRAGGEPVFYVADNGAGFDMSYADKLFTAFQRLHAASEFEGTGIGLATVHRIITRHGGRVWAEGSPGRGATFLFSLTPGAPHEEHPDSVGRGQPRPPGVDPDDAGGEQRSQ